MLELPGVTLVCADTANHALALRAIGRSLAGVRFARALFLTDAVPPGVDVPAGVDVVPIAPLASREDYSRLVLKGLLAHVTTPHALVIQWDGYVVNPAAWDSAFLAFDYVGAPWHWHPEGTRVGNGGFSLRSRKLLAALQDPRIELVEAEDTTICRTFRGLLEREHAIRFADEATAGRFSFEAAYPIGMPFGFHGLFNFCRTVPPEEIAALAPALPDAIARSPQAASLLRNTVAMRQWGAARALARRILAALPDDAQARALLDAVEAGAAAPNAVGRNEPCPCGSGKKYKHCHGAIGDAAAAASPAPPAPDPDALVRQAMAAHQRGDVDGAERGYRSALALAPGHPMATHFLGVAHYQRGRLEDAVRLLRAAVATLPQEPEFHNNLGLALAADDRPGEAIEAYRRALALKPTHAIAWSNLGLALQAENRLDEAVDAFRRALAIDPTFAQAHWNLGLALLARGDFAEGFREYAWRHRTPEFAAHARSWPGPRWDGSAPAGRTILAVAEQGLGDTLQFIRFAAPLAAQGARVIATAQAPLVRLLASAPGVSAVCGPSDPLPACDAHVPLVELAGLLGTTVATIPAEVPYLAADRARRAEVGAMLAPDANALKVGLAWSGSAANTLNRRRSIPLAALAPLLALPGVAWYSLHRSVDEGEIDAVPAAQALRRLPAREDFDGMAALVAELDLIVSVDTSIAHLAGALAQPTWVMLAHAADWRWHPGRTDRPWYPTARLFRQPRAGAWDSVVHDVASALAAPAARHGG
jgi:tetratricopeptide (TPR) repeat protein